MDLSTLRKACRGKVVTPDDADFVEMLHGGLWNRLIPDRSPDILVRVADEKDVAQAIQFARAHNLKVAIRGGGHNWCQPSLRNGGLLIDLGELNRILSIDADARKAVVQPVVSNRDVMNALAPHGLAFPVGHCPDVKLSGYLLGGGIAWNMGTWGPAARSVEAIDIVTAAGEIVTASEHEHADLFWAALGAGCGFFGVATRFHLRLHPLPAAIHGVTYFYAMDDAAEVAAWLGKVAPSISPRVEIVMLLAPAPPELAE
jgi:FAD/FMN-containing dehydrogenase